MQLAMNALRCFFLLVLVAPTGCLRSVASRTCDEPYYAVPGAESMEIDLDCDGTINRLDIASGVDSLGVFRRWLTLDDQRIDLRVEARPQLVGVADVSGDSLEDVLVAARDIGVIVPVVVIRSTQASSTADFQSVTEASAANFTFIADGGVPCQLEGLFRFVETTEGRGVSFPFDNPGENDCGDSVQRRSFIVRGGLFRPVN